MENIPSVISEFYSRWYVGGRLERRIDKQLIEATGGPRIMCEKFPLGRLLEDFIFLTHPEELLWPGVISRPI